MTQQKIVPNLWFDTQAEEAAQLYTSLFENAQIGATTHYSDAGEEAHRRQRGTVMTVEYELDGYQFVALNGGPDLQFNPSTSFFASFPNKEQVKEAWKELSRQGSVLMELDTYPFSELYGWVADRYGLSWQVSLAGEEGAPSIIPALMFVGDRAGQAEKAIEFYTSIFSESEVGDLFHYSAGQEPDKEGNVAFGPFTLAGQSFSAMDSAQEHDFTFNEAISFVVNCTDQAEVDYYWEKLSAVPESQQCGWLKDKFGVSWQIVPAVLSKLLASDDQAQADRVMEALLKMEKLDVAVLEAAAAEND